MSTKELNVHAAGPLLKQYIEFIHDDKDHQTDKAIEAAYMFYVLMGLDRINENLQKLAEVHEQFYGVEEAN